MKGTLSKVFLVRHGETAWSISRQATGRTDIPLTKRGEQDAQKLGTQLQGLNLAQVFTSPLQRARQTAALAGFGGFPPPDPHPTGGDYGA